MHLNGEVVVAALARHPEQAEPLLAVLRVVEAGDLTADGPAAVAVCGELFAGQSARLVRDDIDWGWASTGAISTNLFDEGSAA